MPTRHIAVFLLVSFLTGGLVAPVLHQVHHGIDVFSDTHTSQLHVHPDYGAVSDNSPHLDDKELSCALCSFSLFAGIQETPLTSILDVDSVVSDLAEQYQVLHGSSFPIRGPPSFC